MSTLKENLIKLRGLIDTPEKWTQGMHGRTADGLEALYPKEASCFCLVGAACAVACDTGDYFEANSTRAYRAIIGALVRAIKAQSNGAICTVADFNDNYTHEEVLAIVDKAIDSATTTITHTNGVQSDTCNTLPPTYRKVTSCSTEKT